MSGPLLAPFSDAGARLALALVLLGLLLGGGQVLRAWARQRQNRAMRAIRLVPTATGRPRLIAFAGPGCAACRTQRSILQGLRERWSDGFELEELDATISALAGRLGIVTVPATVVVAPGGRLVAINSGLTQAARLEPQLRAALSTAAAEGNHGGDDDRDDNARGNAA